jgi:hypothetical protein
VAIDFWKSQRRSELPPAITQDQQLEHANAPDNNNANNNASAVPRIPRSATTPLQMPGGTVNTPR